MMLYDRCPLCLCSNREFKLYREGDCSKHKLYREPFDKTLRWLRCERCGHVFRDGFYDAEESEYLFDVVQKKQVVGYQVEEQRFVSARIVEKVRHYTDVGDWLDVGVGNGSLLFTAQEYGFWPVGIDVRKRNVDALLELGVEASYRNIGDLPATRKFAVISLADVLEHMPYPKKAIGAASRLLRKDGVLFVSTPNMDSLAWRVVDDRGHNPYWKEMEHYHVFGRKNLLFLLEEFSFEPIHFGVGERYRFCVEAIARPGGEL